jgi:hypothetical protein
MTGRLRLPSLHREEALAIAPTQVILDHLLLFLMATVVRGIESSFSAVKWLSIRFSHDALVGV